MSELKLEGQLIYANPFYNYLDVATNIRNQECTSIWEEDKTSKTIVMIMTKWLAKPMLIINCNYVQYPSSAPIIALVRQFINHISHLFWSNLVMRMTYDKSHHHFLDIQLHQHLSGILTIHNGPIQPWAFVLRWCLILRNKLLVPSLFGHVAIFFVSASVHILHL